MEEEPTQAKPAKSEIPQQPTLQHPKRKLSKKVISIILIAVVFCSTLGTLGFFYLDLNNKYDTLELEHTRLQASYNQLNASFADLNNRFNILNAQYNSLNTQYQSLSTDYDALSHAFNEPLPYEEIPSTAELRQWLTADKTDEILYNDPNFKCGDFAVMLSQHAKLKHWDMGIVAVFGYTETYESYAHAFNALIAVEGLVYVGPQNDHVWWYSDHEAIYEGAGFEIDNEWVYVEDYVVIVSFD